MLFSVSAYGGHLALFRFHAERRFSTASHPAQAEFSPDGANDSKDSQEGHDLIVMELTRVEEIGELDEGPIRDWADDDARRPEHAEDQERCPPRLYKVENENADEGGSTHRDNGFENRDGHQGAPSSITLSAFRTNPLQAETSRRVVDENDRESLRILSPTRPL